MKDGGQFGAVAGEFSGHPAAEVEELGLGVVAAGDSRLVGDDGDGIAAIDSPAGEGEDAVGEFEAVAAGDVTVVVIDDAVAIQQQCRPP